MGKRKGGGIFAYRNINLLLHYTMTKKTIKISQYWFADECVEVRHKPDNGTEYTMYWYTRKNFGIMLFQFGVQGDTENDEFYLHETLKRGRKDWAYRGII